MWDVGDDGELSEVAPEAHAERWLPVFVPFQTSGEDVQMRFLPVERYGLEPLSCTEISVPAAAEVGAVTLELLECPTENWRTQRLTIRDDEGGVAYQFSAQPTACVPEPDDAFCSNRLRRPLNPPPLGQYEEGPSTHFDIVGPRAGAYLHELHLTEVR